MSCKSFNICVVFDILNVTCPGVWICPKGKVYLDVWLFGNNRSTSFVEPKFPLVLNETFSFHENFAEASDLRGVQKCLEDKYVQISLVQVYTDKQVTLAVYSSNIDEVLYPKHNNRLSRNGETTLFMKNEPLFPGTISPKITVITKTSVSEQIHGVLQNMQCSTQNSETQHRPNRMKRVHHSKLTTNSECCNKINYRTCNEDEITNTDTDTDNQLYCRNAVNDIVEDGENYFQKSCTFCEEHMKKLKINRHRKESSDRKDNMPNFKMKGQSSDNNKIKRTEITSNKFGKNIKATFNIVPHHHYKCCKSKLNNNVLKKKIVYVKGNSSNESSKISDEEIRRSEHEKHEDSGEEPNKINPKIQLHLDVYHCKCGKPNCFTSRSWRNICHEVNRKDTVGDEIKYHVSLRNYYRRLYDGATYQLCRNLKQL